MSRKNIKVSPEVHERLSESKPDGHTWDGYLHHLLDAYHDSRPRIPKYVRSDQEGAGRDLEQLAAMTPERKRELADRAKELRDEVDFKELLEQEDSEPSVHVIAEMTAERVVQKLEGESDE